MPEKTKAEIAAEKRGEERGKLISTLDQLCGDIVNIGQTQDTFNETLTSLRERLAILETKTLFICVGTSIVVSMVVSVIGGVILWAVTK